MPSDVSDRKDAPKSGDAKTEATTAKHLAQAGIRSIQGKQQPEMNTASLNSLRQTAVRHAWKQESELVKATGHGTREWKPGQLRSLARGDKIKGYEGHHIRSVNHHSPKWAGDPRNIEFVTRKEHLDRHRGDFHTPTTGKLVDRQKQARMEATNRQPVRYLPS